MKVYSVIFLLITLSLPNLSFSRQQSFEVIRNQFISGYKELKMSGIQLSYVSMLQSIKSSQEIEIQEQFFNNAQNSFSTIDVSKLSDLQLLDYKIMHYETQLNLGRIQLEKKWIKVPLDETRSIFSIPEGKNWYRWLLKRWVDIEAEPDSVFKMGVVEVTKVKSNMSRLQKKSGLTKDAFDGFLNNDQFYLTDVSKIEKEFRTLREKVNTASKKMFPFIDDIPEVGIQRGTNINLSQVPGFYSNQTFYFNYFDEPFNTRQLGWLYLHEAIPGHHYQSSVTNLINRTELQKLFWYPGFAEGWGAYVEYLGIELNAYNSIYDEYGKWEWDLIRSVRVPLDIGINYYGWNEEKSLNFWKEHITGLDEIGIREIKRMTRWPAQVITYKYGSSKIMRLLEKVKKTADFNYLEFHKGILEHGDVPISFLE